MKKEDVKVKKLNNKGFSLVEIIIVIAIMAILAGALAPQLIKYIDKSRKSADVQAAQTIALAVNTALADEEAYTIAADTELSTCYTATSPTVFQKIIKEIIGGTSTSYPKPKLKDYDDFWIDIKDDRTFSIYAYKTGTTSENTVNILYPTVGNNFK